LCGPRLDDEFLIPFGIRNSQFVGPAADLAVFDIFLIFALRGVNESMVELSTVRTSEGGGMVGMLGFHGWHNILYKTDYSLKVSYTLWSPI
jgi:hypothetical protein